MIEIGNQKLTLEQVYRVATTMEKVSLSQVAIKKINRSNATVRNILKSSDEPHYGINTGFGSLKSIQIEKGKLKALQLNFIRSHAVGVGPPLPKEAVRAMMVLRPSTLAQGYSGVQSQPVGQILS